VQRIREEALEIVTALRRSLAAYADMGFEGLFPKVAQAIPQQTCQGFGMDPRRALEDLRERIGDCHRCRLHQGRTHLVFGEGSPQARLVFVGEAPGRDEDLAGRPFVGEAGRLLSRIIENGMGLRREDVYIMNVVKCRPPQNRDPKPDEIGACMPFMREQIRIIAPEVICTLGRVAGSALLGGDFRIRRDRGEWRDYDGVELMPTYHPAYLLRYPSAKRETWEDIKKVMARLGLEGKGRG